MNDPLGMFTALGIFERAWKKKNVKLIEVPTPYGTFVFKKRNWTPERAIKRVCEKCGVPAMTVANWLKDWDRNPVVY